MKVVVHNRNDGGITISHFSPSLLSVMTGNGYGWGQDRIDYEVGKFVAAGKSEEIVRPYMDAVANGGVTEEKAIDLIRAKDEKADCLGCKVINNTDLT